MKSHTEPAVAPDDSQLSPDDDSSQTLYNSAGLKVKSFIRRCIEKYRTSGASHESNGRSLLSLELECSREVENGARRRSFVVQLRKHIFADTLKRFLPHLKFLKYHINPYGESINLITVWGQTFSQGGGGGGGGGEGRKGLETLVAFPCALGM